MSKAPMTRRRKSGESSFPFYCLGLLRVLLVLAPQNGYIHPDEYFQSVEVLAGKIFDVEYSPPWEFNTTHPIRGMSLPFFTTGLSYIFLRDINRLAIEYLSLNVVTPYFLLVVPRLIVTILSFIIDYCLKKICLNNNEKYKSRLLILGTSYVILVYETRTFSNSFELILFALLLYFVCESQTFSNDLVRKQEYIKYRYEKSTSVVEKAKFHKLKLYLVSDNYRNCLVIASLSVFGVFNRPTFIGYALMPVFFWIYRGTEEKRVSVLQFHTRMLFLALCSLPALVFNIIIDSFYYGYITWGEIGMLDVSLNNFVVTPLNFLRYNFDSSNLETHGLHPRWLHLLVNIPLLFNALGCVALFTLGKYFYWCFGRKLHLLPSIKSIKMLMTMSFISPVLILSIFPHQEPRFLVPIIFPLVYLHSEQILPENVGSLVKVPESSIQDRKKELKKKSRSNELLKLWLLTNAIFVCFYGFVHQGGVFPAVKYLQKDISFAPKSAEFHIVTSGTYSLPQSFLLQKASGNLYANSKVKYSVRKRVFLYEEGSRDLTEVLLRFKSRQWQGNERVYLLIPNSRAEQTERTVKSTGMSMVKLDSFWPHLSTEALPDFTKYCFNPTFIFYKNCQVLSLWEYLGTISGLCQLTLYEVNLKLTEVHT